MIFTQDRTNNYAKAAHRRLKTELGMEHPTLWSLINHLRKAQKTRDIDFEAMIAGHAPPSKRKRYRDADERILTLINRFNGNAVEPPQTMWEFLRGIAHNYMS